MLFLDFESIQLIFIAKTCLITLLKIILLLVSIAYYTLAERKIMASIQRRRGPNVVGLWGLLQPLADGLKLLSKQMLIPSKANSNMFLLSPLLILTFSLLTWVIIPFDLSDTCNALSFTSNGCENLIGSPEFVLEVNSIANVSYGLLVILAISSIIVYLLIIGGWASNSKYAFLGALRSAAQMISYEVSISLVILPVVLLAGTLNLTEIVIHQGQTIWYCFPLLPCAIIFLISMLAETNRTPFDLPEAEAELVAGYNTEYSSINFAMFFLGEYCNMILMSALMIILFVGGWLANDFFVNIFFPSFIFSFKTSIICFFFVLVRATFPRYRYDQLMDIGWKVFLPITLGFLIFISGILMIFNSGVYVHEVLPQVFSSSILPITIFQ